MINKGEIILTKAYGEANIATHRKADSTTLFHVASIGKTINALCIMKLVEDGKLSLKTDSLEYLKMEVLKSLIFQKRKDNYRQFIESYRRYQSR